MEVLPHLTVICEDRYEDVFWYSALFWEVFWEPDGVYIVQVVYCSVESLLIESFGQEEV